MNALWDLLLGGLACVLIQCFLIVLVWLTYKQCEEMDNAHQKIQEREKELDS